MNWDFLGKPRQFHSLGFVNPRNVNSGVICKKKIRRDQTIFKFQPRKAVGGGCWVPLVVANQLWSCTTQCHVEQSEPVAPCPTLSNETSFSQFWPLPNVATPLPPQSTISWWILLDLFQVSLHVIGRTLRSTLSGSLRGRNDRILNYMDTKVVRQLISWYDNTKLESRI